MITTTNDWLQTLSVIAGNENSGNHSPKLPDDSLDYLIELLNQGYDRVTWVGSARDKAENEICQRYDSNQTTWSLKSFLNIAGSFKSLSITKQAKSKDEYTEQQWMDIITDPSRALKFARENNFQNLDEDIIDAISKDDIVSNRFVNQFLKVKRTDSIPQAIVNATLNDADAVYYLADIYSENQNLPVEYKEMTKGMQVGEEAVYGPYTSSDANIPYNAPIYSHSHVECKCFLKVWKSTDPSDVVYVDAHGRF